MAEAPTRLVVTVNVALVDPAATVTLAGTVAAAVLLLESVTAAPPLGAGLASVTVPCVGLPPVKLMWASVREASAGGAEATVRVAVRVVPLREAEIVTAVETPTVKVLTVKVALAAPAGTVTPAGTVATAVLLLDSVTTMPPAGAAPLSATVPCEGLPPSTLVGLSVNEDSAGGSTVSEAVCVAPP